MRIGIDFDNTIICYDQVFCNLAKAWKLVDVDYQGSKSELKYIIQKSHGDVMWQKLQGKAYGEFIHQAEIFSGIKDFISACNAVADIELFIVSHKTEFGHFDEKKISLRDASRQWLREQGLFDQSKHYIPEENVFFETTREEKIERIKQLQCTHFIDDLEEVLHSPLFPTHIKKFLFRSSETNWADIKNAIFSTEDNWQAEKINKLKSLLACDDLEVIAKKGGGNSVVFCVTNGEHKWAVKSYPPYAPNQRDRLAAELTVYQFLNQHNIQAVPLLKTYCETNRWLIIDWIEGEIPNSYSSLDVAQAIQFIRSINTLNKLREAKNLPLAAEACLSLTAIIQQIQRRLERLQSLPEGNSALSHFLTHDFQPAFAQFKEQAINGYKLNKLDPDAELVEEKRSLIPADFGFHNTIRDEAGKLYFFDFDYFGWDDPVKLLADILWHPKMQLTEAHKQQFIDGLSCVYAADPQFLTRFYYTWPLFGLRWVLILLNEFIPAFWQNRQHADAYKNLASNQEQAQNIQLKRARELLLNVQQIGCPYEAIAATSV